MPQSELHDLIVELRSVTLGVGEGRSKKAAEQLAAEAAWRMITAESGPPATPGSAG